MFVRDQVDTKFGPFVVGSHQTILEFKAQLLGESDISIPFFYFVCDGKQLQNDDTFASSNVMPNSVLQLIPTTQEKGGGKEPVWCVVCEKPEYVTEKEALVLKRKSSPCPECGLDRNVTFKNHQEIGFQAFFKYKGVYSPYVMANERQFFSLKSDTEDVIKIALKKGMSLEEQIRQSKEQLDRIIEVFAPSNNNEEKLASGQRVINENEIDDPDNFFSVNQNVRPG